MKLTDERTTLFQWDTGRSVTADSAQVHFSNKQLGRSFDVDVENGVALIPDMLLTCAAPIKAWAWVGTATEGYTKEELIIPVQPRNKPADYVFTPTEQTTLADIQGQIGDLSELKTTARDNLVDAINEAAKSGKPIKLQAKDIDISENGETSVSPDYGYDGLSKVNIKTNVAGGGGVPYNIGHGLKVDTETNTLSVDTVSSVEQDNTLPITSAAVYAEVGNINALLGTI